MIEGCLVSRLMGLLLPYSKTWVGYYFMDSVAELRVGYYPVADLWGCYHSLIELT
jgi:hypothetical protein